MNSREENYVLRKLQLINDLKVKKMSGLVFRVLAIWVAMGLTAFSSNSALAQCKADSVISYRTIAGQREVASIEYFTFDLKDSLITNRLIEFQNGKALPLYENRISYAKVKGNTVVTHEKCSWIADRAEFKPHVRVVHTYSKKGFLISEVHSDLTAGADGQTFVAAPKAKMESTYTLMGQIEIYLLSRWNGGKSIWTPESQVFYTYENGLMSESTVSDWDSVNQVWIPKWRNDVKYNADQSISESVTYEFDNYAWIPDTRTSYGYDTSQAVKGNVVQKWNGGKRGWDNKFYYVMKMNEQGLTDTEIHLSWSGKEWVVDLTVHYVYNEQGELIQILNDKKEVMIERFCR